MSEASRWLDAFATASALVGLRADEVAAMLPEGVAPPAWLLSSASRQARAARLARQAMSLTEAVEAMSPVRHVAERGGR